MVSPIDGNAKCSHHPGDISPIASDQPSTMAWMPQSDASEIPPRPPLASHQSSSLPSTPYQHARNLSFHSRSPSPARGSTSPRSTHSESTHLPPSARKPLGVCKYETAMAYFRRRIPYSLGADILPQEKEGLKGRLNPTEEQKLSADIMDLYDRLLPSAESDDRRRQLVRKLEKLFNDQWPGHEIKAHVFGSSGNKLCSSDSDVDICITTNYKELEHVCLLAEVLAKHGMQRVVCVSHAKVPIVKIWDPELRLACDMNVNNTLALENTRMIRTYVEVDERVRPLAMSVKHWTKRRILNDAALGGTLSSYTWICLIINFLQTRDPPILPSLQARPHKKRVTSDGLVCSFDDNLDSLTQFGRKNKQSVGELFFEFFRYYGHELDYEKNVISVREGNLISKEAKGWHLLMNNRLCVEEPFNTSRNLGNTADDTSFRGLHLELRRAFKHAAQGDLIACCEQFEFPAEEERTWERPPPQPRPILTPSLPSRGGRGGGRGGRYPNQFSRGGYTGGRRASNTGNKSNAFRQSNTGNPSEISLQAQQQAQYLLHDQLYQQIQLLQAQEQELRMQLHNQALITGRPPPVFLCQPFIQFPIPQQQEYSGDEGARSRSGTVSHPPPNTLQRQQSFKNPTYASVSASNPQGSTTNPPSPSANVALPDFRRNSRRSSAVNGSPKGSLRAQSQPARPQNSPSLQNFLPFYTIPQHLENSHGSKQRSATDSSEGGEGSGDENALPPNSLPSNGSRSDSVDGNRPQDVLGYYLTPQQLQAYQQNSVMPSLSTPVGLALPNGYTPFVPVQQEYRPATFSPEGFNGRSEPNNTTASKPQPSQPRRSASRPAVAADRGPLIVDGSVPPSEPRSSSYTSDFIDPYTAVTHYTSTSDDHNINTPASFSDSLSQDFQDSGPFEMEQSGVFTRPPVDAQKTNHVGDEKPAEKANGQPQLLASRLQNYHLSNAEKLAQSHPPPKASSERPKNGVHSGTGKEASKQGPAGDKSTSSSGAPHETRPQASNSKRRPNGVEHPEKVNGVNHKPKSKGRHDAPQHSTPASESKDRHVDHPPRKSGGAPNGVTDTSHGGWQTTKKKNRKNTKTSSETRNGDHSGPEPLPADESLRKGG
ncbi:PAP/25A-associated [Penicillium alfredii]|uniref:polynucleotide adenylyltransferase n=1 Tax=Penicillium alfredii TaxID=1506179 RepID=A0A9W9FRU7_9EURO|nr:PAP/25A-associated [Penicillium alfredii]KAJ5104825.1 PAP/25A-associated [Penicillium alfredii]